MLGADSGRKHVKTQDHAGDCGGSSCPRLSHPVSGEWCKCPESCPRSRFGPYSACSSPLLPFSRDDFQISLSTAYKRRCCSWLGGPIYCRVFLWPESLRTVSPCSPSPVSPSNAPGHAIFRGSLRTKEDEEFSCSGKQVPCPWQLFGRGGTRAVLWGGWHGHRSERTAVSQAVWEAAVQKHKNQTKRKQVNKKNIALASARNSGQ